MNTAASARLLHATDAPASFSVWWERRNRRDDRRERSRWLRSSAVVAAASVVGSWAVMHMPQRDIVVAEPTAMPAIAMDLAPLPTPAPAPPVPAPEGATVSPLQAAPDPTPPPVSAPPSPTKNPPVPVPKPDKHAIFKKKIKAEPSPDKVLPQQVPMQTIGAPPAADAPAVDPAHAVPSTSRSVHASHALPTWQGELLARLERFKRYPAEAMADKQEGTSTVRFSMDRQGHVLAAHIVNSSGHTALDEETLALLRRAEPLPKPPDEVNGNPITLTVPVEFYVNENRD